METVAKARFQRISLRKVRVILNMVRGRNVAKALDALRFTRKAAAPIVLKLIDSAVANARQRDDKLDLDTLFVKTAYADKATNSHMRRWRPRAHGRASMIQKGVSHLFLELSDGSAPVGPTSGKALARHGAALAEPAQKPTRPKSTAEDDDSEETTIEAKRPKSGSAKKASEKDPEKKAKAKKADKPEKSEKKRKA